MSHIIQVEDRYYILATSSLADDRTRVLKHGETFAVFDRYGDVQPVGLGEQGIYHEGTRFLSSVVLSLGRDRPLLLSSTVREDNALLAVDLTNPDIAGPDGQVEVPRGALHLFRSKFLWRGVCYERLRIHNYALERVDFAFELHFDADFVDLFEVRGMKRERRGSKLEPSVGADFVELGYVGLDRAERRTRIAFDPPPSDLDSKRARYEASLEPRGEATFHVTFACATDGGAPEPIDHDEAAAEARSSIEAGRREDCAIRTSNELFNDWLGRSLADLHMMLTRTPHGVYPYAGVPWFSTAFGRDGILTALQVLWVNPGVARGVLSFLAATQADAVVPEQDAQPGKILHETRKGEMAAMGEIPFGRYYGTVDATPLFVILAGEYFRHTNDVAFMESIWGNVERAIAWIDTWGDEDGDGFVEYMRRSPEGLVQQGWKDSSDSVFHADGALAEGPIALCEVQGYVYAARLAAADMCAALGRPEEAGDQRRRADELKHRFAGAFWSDELGTFALALDGAKRPCLVKSSNAGHCLWSGIAEPEHARRAAATLLGDEMFSGWGIRTLGAGEVRYDPMSYHNGSIWPHDNALVAAGLARYGFKSEVERALAALFDASLFIDLHRLPELFCGFTRRHGQAPVLYPVACSPQSWASAAVFQLLQSALGLVIDARRSRVRFEYPRLPPFLERVELRDLRVNRASLDLMLLRHEDDVGINILRRDGDVEVVIVK